jgi:hypothetical protein
MELNIAVTGIVLAASAPPPLPAPRLVIVSFLSPASQVPNEALKFIVLYVFACGF